MLDWLICYSEGSVAVARCQEVRYNIRQQSAGVAVSCNVLCHQRRLLPLARSAHHDRQLPYLLSNHGSCQENRSRQPVPVSQFFLIFWCLDVLIMCLIEKWKETGNLDTDEAENAAIKARWIFVAKISQLISQNSLCVVISRKWFRDAFRRW